jgi:hypothetical protein
MNPYWSWGLCVIGTVGLLMAGRRHWWAWLILLFNEAIWIVYGWVTKQYGFIAAAIIYGCVYLHNMKKWKSLQDPARVGEPVDAK